MEAIKILSADILDIIFDGHNKEYGAYELRKSYHRRLGNALLTTGIICLVFILMYNLTPKKNSATNQMYVGGEIEISKLPPERKPDIPQIPKIKQPQIERIKWTVPLIVKENEIPREDKPPTVTEIDQASIATKTEHGIHDEITSPPIVDSKDVIEKTKGTDDPGPFIPIEIESNYPGGMEAWLRYLNKTLKYPSDAAETGIEGDVVVKFIVDKDGKTSEVEAIQGPQELRGEAIRVIKSSGKWDPAIQNGLKVKSYKQQTIKFRLETQ
jgi:periplasmic protein TonB